MELKPRRHLPDEFHRLLSELEQIDAEAWVAGHALGPAAVAVGQPDQRKVRQSRKNGSSLISVDEVYGWK
jgi:hypothetical protein